VNIFIWRLLVKQKGRAIKSSGLFAFTGKTDFPALSFRAQREILKKIPHFVRNDRKLIFLRFVISSAARNL